MLPKSRSPGLGPLARAVDVVEDPADLRAREVGGERQAGLLAEAVLAAVGARARRQSLSVRVSCQTIALWTGSPVFLSHTTVGLALVGDAQRRDVVGARAGGVERLVDDLLRALPDLHRVVLDPARLRDRSARAPSGRRRRPRRRGRRSCTACWSCPGRALRVLRPRSRSSSRSRRFSRPAPPRRRPPHGQQQARRRRPGILVAGAALAQVARAALARDQRDRRLHALLGRLGGPLERAARASLRRRPRAAPRAPGSSASSIVLSPGSALPRAAHAVDARVERGRPSRRGRARTCRPRTGPSAGRTSRRAGPPAPPTLETSVMPTVFSDAPMSSPSAGVQLLERLRHPTVHVGPVVAVADRAESSFVRYVLGAPRPRRRSRRIQLRRPRVRRDRRPSCAPAQRRSCAPARPTAA